MASVVQLNAARRWLALALLGAWAGFATAQTHSHWRVYRAADGLADSRVTAVSVGSRGLVWASHGGSGVLSRLDGHTISQGPAPRDHYRLYESPAGTLWSLYDEGLQEFKAGQWVFHPVSRIRAEMQADPLRRVRQIPLLPLAKDRVLFLLSQGLMEFNPGTGNAVTLLEAGRTAMERFLDMAAAADGGVWITGRKGLVKLGPDWLRNPDFTDWKATPFPAGLQLENGLRPVADGGGGVILVADSLATRKRVSVDFDGNKMQIIAAPGESLRQSWRDRDGRLWGLTINALLQLDPEAQNLVAKEELGAGQLYDFALETNGVFWLATAEGLYRHAPALWRAPPELSRLNAPVHSLRQDRPERLWLLSANALGRFENGPLKLFGFETEPGQFRQSAQAPFFLPDGQVALNINDQLRLFNPDTGQFLPVSHPAGHALEVVGQFSEAGLCVKCFDPRQWQAGYRLEVYDGRQFMPFLAASNTAALGREIHFVQTITNGGVWIGGGEALGLFYDKQWRVFRPSESRGASPAFCLLEWSEGRIWLGGRDRIVEFDGKTWRTVRTGLDRVNALLRGRDGSVWAATDSGLYRQVKGQWTSHAQDEGLPSAAVYALCEDHAGRLWAGTARGVSRYEPDADRDPPVAQVENPQSLKQFSADEPLTVYFAGHDKWKYTPPERLLYSWRLDGGEWSAYSGVGFAQLRHPGIGPHRFEARAMDRNLNETSTPALVEFSILAPWYREPRVLVMGLLGLLAALFFAGLAVNRHLRLARSYAEVGRMVAQRTRELEQANQQLLHSQKMTALGTLAAGIAHDFNNILSIIRGSVQIIEGNLDDKEKIRLRVERIKTVTDQGAGIIKAMLGYSREETKAMTPLDLNALLAETMKLFGDRFLRQVAVRFEPAADLPPVVGYRDLLQQMALNLVLNAADALPPSGEIVLRTGQLGQLPSPLVLPPASAPRYAYLAVADNGSGIPADILPRIFEPFFTTKAISSRRGTGLGLSMVYQFAQEMHYGLAVQSEVGRGSTFTILLPVQPPASGTTGG